MRAAAFALRSPPRYRSCPSPVRIIATGPAGTSDDGRESEKRPPRITSITQTRRGAGAGAAAALTLVLVAALTVAAAVDDDVGASAAPVLVLDL